MPSSSPMPPKTLPCRCDDRRGDRSIDGTQILPPPPGVTERQGGTGWGLGCQRSIGPALAEVGTTSTNVGQPTSAGIRGKCGVFAVVWQLALSTINELVTKCPRNVPDCCKHVGFCFLLRVPAIKLLLRVFVLNMLCLPLDVVIAQHRCNHSPQRHRLLANVLKLLRGLAVHRVADECGRLRIASNSLLNGCRIDRISRSMGPKFFPHPPGSCPLLDLRS